MKRDPKDRVKMVKAMEYIVRQINDEDVFMGWLYAGVADGDIEYGDLDVMDEDVENYGCYIGNQEFAELMGLFLKKMSQARKSGGLYCDGVLSEE